jgi:hypothetical protein
VVVEAGDGVGRKALAGEALGRGGAERGDVEGGECGVAQDLLGEVQVRVGRGVSGQRGDDEGGLERGAERGKGEEEGRVPGQAKEGPEAGPYEREGHWMEIALRLHKIEVLNLKGAGMGHK